MKKIVRQILILTFSVILTACGGSTSSSSEQDDAVIATVNPSMTTNAVIESNVTTDTVTPNLSTDEIAVTEEPLPQLPTTSSSSSSSTNQTENNIQTSQVIANAGADRNTRVNETITLTGTVSNVETESLSYKWTKGITVLSTTASFDYAPKEEDALPTAGHRVDVLTFTVSTENGDSFSDSVNITVLP